MSVPAVNSHDNTLVAYQIHIVMPNADFWDNRIKRDGNMHCTALLSSFFLDSSNVGSPVPLLNAYHSSNRPAAGRIQVNCGLIFGFL
jgi:hypothetical protein